MLIELVCILAAAVLICMLIDFAQVPAPTNRVAKIVVAVVALIVALFYAGLFHR